MGIVILGAGGLGREVLAVLRAAGRDIAGFLVEPGYATAPVHGVPVRNTLGNWSADAGTRFVVAVGDGRARTRLVTSLGEVHFVTAVHPAALLGPRVLLGEGAMVIGPVSATTDIVIGPHALVSPGCTLAHDCSVEAFASLGPGVSLSSRVTVATGASLGVGAVVTSGCCIGAWAVVAAGAVVTRDVEPGTTVE